MKIFQTFAMLVLGAMLFTACTASVDEILVDQDGRWNVDQNKTESYLDGQLDPDNSETINNDGVIDFDAAGTASWTNAQNETTNFNWTYDADMEQITISDDSSSFTMDVIESGNDSQEWSGEIEFEIFGINFRTVQTLKLSRL